MGLIDLFRPKWKHSNEKKRKLAVIRLTSRQILSDIAVHDASSMVRTCAVGKLAQIPGTDGDDSGIQAGIATLGDEDLLNLISFWNNTRRTRHTIIDHLKSQNSLLDALLKAIEHDNEEKSEFRRYVVAKIVDVDLLYALLAGDRGYNDRMMSSKLLDAELSIIAGDIAVVKDDATLFALVMRGWDFWPGFNRYYPGEILIQGIGDQAMLKRIIYEFDSKRCKRTAIERLSDPAMLAEIATNEQKFKDLSLLAAQVLGNLKDSRASSSFPEVLKSVRDTDRLLDMIDIIRKMTILSPEIKTEIGGRIGMLRECFSSEPEYVDGEKEYDGEYMYVRLVNERYGKLKSAIEWIENL